MLSENPAKLSVNFRFTFDNSVRDLSGMTDKYIKKIAELRDHDGG